MTFEQEFKAALAGMFTANSNIPAPLQNVRLVPDARIEAIRLRLEEFKPRRRTFERVVTHPAPWVRRMVGA